MTSNVSPEEVDALLESDSASAAAHIAPRDFRKPRRLSLAQQRALRSAVTKRISRLEDTVRAWLQSDYGIELADIGETSTHGLFEELEDPIVVRNIDAGGAQGWIVWENPAAVAAATVAMSCELDEEAEPRNMTPLESGLVGDFLLALAEEIAPCLGLTLTGGPLSQSVRGFLSQLDTDEDGDPQRLFLHLGLEGPGGPSTLRLYLPGVLPEASSPSELPPALPSHLEGVPVDICAELGTVEIALDELMKLEPGDVIPLASIVGDPLDVCVEGRPAGKASWGHVRGRLAMRIEHMNPDLLSS